MVRGWLRKLNKLDKIIIIIIDDNLEVILGSHVSRGVSSQPFVVIADIETEGEEYVVPNEHLHARFFAWIYCHYVAINDGLSSASGGRDEIRVNLNKNMLHKPHLANALLKTIV